MNTRTLWAVLAVLGLALAGCPSGDAGKTPAKPAKKDDAAKKDDGAKKDDAAKKDGAAKKDDAPASPDGALTIGTKLTDEQKKAATELAAKVKRGKFPWAEQAKKENAELFLHLAATSDKKEVVAAALHGMSRSWTYWKKNDKKMHVNEDYQAVVRARLGSSDDNILGRAIEAAPNAIAVDNPDKAVVSKLAAMAKGHKNAAARVAATDAIARAKDFQKNADIVDALLDALDDKEAYVVSTALFRMQFSAYSIVKKDALYAKAKELLGHKDQGVRGRAAVFAANLAQSNDQKKELGGLIFPMLKDEAPFVRSYAATALSTLKRQDAIHAFMGMLEDTEKNSYNIKYTKLTGEPGTVHHDGSAWSRVDDAVLYSLKSMTWSMGDKKFQYGKINYKTVDKDLAAAKKEAKAWYKKHKKDLPPAQ